MLTSGAEQVGAVEGVPVDLQPVMVPLDATAEITIDVIDDLTSEVTPMRAI